MPILLLTKDEHESFCNETFQKSWSCQNPVHANVACSFNVNPSTVAPNHALNDKDIHANKDFKDLADVFFMHSVKHYQRT